MRPLIVYCSRTGNTRRVVEVMAELNRPASEAMVEVGVSACTDVTGYGLLGHLMEMLEASGVSARIHVSGLPVLDGVRDKVLKGAYPGGTRKNLEHFTSRVRWQEDVTQADRLILADAQTSGGLLIAVSAERVDALLSALEDRDVATRAVIGEIIKGEAGTAEVVWD